MEKKLVKFMIGLTFLGATGIFYGCSNRASDAAVFQTKESAAPATTEAVKSTEEIADGTENEPAIIYVYICGQVKNPGVYEMDAGSRAVDVVTKAGGFTEDACKDEVNLARVVADEEKLYIPSVEEVQSGDYASEAETSQSSGQSRQNDKININTATKDELMELPGIGEAKAGSIISYRETNGSFSSIEDITKVEGIKSGVFNKIKDYITVE